MLGGLAALVSTNFLVDKRERAHSFLRLSLSLFNVTDDYYFVMHHSETKAHILSKLNFLFFSFKMDECVCVWIK